jgi:tRNA(Ile)-lysidine synthase
MDPLSTFLEFVKGEQLFNEKDRVLLAVSGGKDSVFMARLFAQSNFDFAIAHCNFQLRGYESDADADFVEDLANRMDVPFYSTVFETEKLAKSKKISIQMAARELRYAWLEEIRELNAYDYIAIAHHQTDSVETVLINLVRGTGIAGLHGILPKRDHIVRPIMAFTSEEVNQYVHTHSIAYREDRSNKETKYARNKIRLEVLPVLKQINPSLETTFASSSRRFHSLEKFIDSQIMQIRESIFLKQNQNIFHIPIELIRPYLKDPFVLFELFNPFSFSEAVLSDLTECLSKKSTGSIFYSSTHQLLIDRDKIILRETQTPLDFRFYIQELPAEFTWREKRFKVSLSVDTTISKNLTIAKVDASKVVFPIEIRSWQDGDSFIPFGLKGTKKISDFLINLKISADEKDNVPLFVNSNNDILWIAPYRIDERYKISEKTKKVIIFEQI